MMGVVWSILTFPFRLVAWVVEVVGRLVGVVLGFVLMVVGVALGAAGWLGAAVGIPLFIIGLLLTLRSLG